ncbi:unnamed protein product [Caenorhabditis angaria]|uniref:Uncharacterized protein n=1 Tax=Caenorhabditis angaria TaxID=860376 RepID=A0A9P1J008_9PELO|nr:unnamed protein product [Caenorhabditis angaria]
MSSIFYLFFLIAIGACINTEEVQKVVAAKWINAIRYPAFFNILESFEPLARISKCGILMTPADYKKTLITQNLDVFPQNIFIENENSFIVNYQFSSRNPIQNQNLQMFGYLRFVRNPVNQQFSINFLEDQCYRPYPKVTLANLIRN